MIALITGASRGIGKAAASPAISPGWCVSSSLGKGRAMDLADGILGDYHPPGLPPPPGPPQPGPPFPPL